MESGITYFSWHKWSGDSPSGQWTLTHILNKEKTATLCGINLKPLTQYFDYSTSPHVGDLCTRGERTAGTVQIKSTRTD